MSNFGHRFDDYSRAELESELDFVLGAAETVKRFVRNTTDPKAIDLLVEKEADERYGRGPESVRETILTSPVTPFETKQEILQRDADDLGTIRVPDRVEHNARTALQVGKPVVLYGPTGTGKTHFAKQLLAEAGEGRDLQLTDDVNIVCTMNMSDRTVNELDDAITRRFAMIELRGYEEADRRKLYDDWLDAEPVFEGETTVGSIDPTPESGFTPGREQLIDLFETHHAGINEGATTDEDTPITEFGPMHYRDVIQFVGVACGDDGAYATRHARAVGEAFATYVTPRLLNTAALPQIERLADHYQTLDEEFPAFDLGPAVELVERQAETERRGIAGGVYE